MQRFGIVRVLGTSLRLFGHNIVPFLVVALAVYAPTLALRHTLHPDDSSLYTLGIGVLLDSIIAAIVTYGVIMDLHGTRPSYKDCVLVGLRHLPAVIGVVVLGFIAIGIGLVLLVIPGVILALMVYVAIPVAVIERPGLMASLQRSRDLTDGYKGALFVILLATWLGKAAFARMLVDVLGGDALVYASLAADAIFGVFVAVTSAVAYTALRADREGVELPAIATAIASVRSRS